MDWFGGIIMTVAGVALLYVIWCVVQQAREPNDTPESPQKAPRPYEVVFDDKGNMLACYGCAHSAAAIPYPSQPSGERPCVFCVRNSARKDQLRSIGNYPEQWNNGTPLTKKAPLDMFIALDRLMEERNLRRIAGERGTPVHSTIEDTMDAMNTEIRDYLRDSRKGSPHG